MTKTISLTLLFILSVFFIASCSGDDPIKAKRIAIENGTYKPESDNNNGNTNNPGGDNSGGSTGDNPGGNGNQPGDNGGSGGNGDTPGGGSSDNPGGNSGDNGGGGNSGSGGNVDQPQTSTLHFSFDQWMLVDKYKLPIETGDDKKAEADRYWQSASNVGAKMAFYRDEKSFPVYVIAGANGTPSGVMIQTVKGSAFAGPKLIPGSLYSGSIDRKNMGLTADGLKATLFGRDVQGIPRSISFYYQYTPGKNLIDKGGKAQTGTDQAAVACVFYDVTTDKSYLNGYTLYSDSRIIAKVLINPEKTLDGKWHKAEAELEIVDAARYKAVDFAKGQYRMVLSFASSAQGDKMIGAIGSRLSIDEVSVTMLSAPKQ